MNVAKPRLRQTTVSIRSYNQQLQALRDQTNPRQLRQEIYTLLDYLLTLPCAPPGITQDVYQTLLMPSALPKGEDAPVTNSFDLTIPVR